MTILLETLGDHLAYAGTTVSIVVVGGAALALRGWVQRTTQDVDVLAMVDEAGAWSRPAFPPALVDAAERVRRDHGLPADWLNDAVARQWAAGPPISMGQDVEWREFGALRVGIAGRAALIALKLFAAVDCGQRSVHCQDLLALAPSREELEAAAEWVRTQDAAPEWPRVVEEVVDHVCARR